MENYFLWKVNLKILNLRIQTVFMKTFSDASLYNWADSFGCYYVAIPEVRP